MIVNCHFCGDELDTKLHTVWRQVTGWERKASGSSRKGGSDIVLREALERVACGGCIDREKRGVAAHQESLI